MANSTYSMCNDFPWQAAAPCVTVNYKDEMLAARQVFEIIYHRSPKKFTEEAVYMIYVILAFVGLAVLGSSVTVCEFFLKDNEKKAKSQQNGHNERIPKPTMTVLKESLSAAGHDFFEDCKSVLKCFCILRNGRKILSTAPTDGQIGCFQGLRFLCNAWIIGIHFGFIIFGALRQTEEIKPLLDYRVSQLVLNGVFAVDIFFVISGFLNAKAFFNKYSKSNGNISWFYFYIKRFVRLTPVYIIVLGFNTTLFSYTGTGILWPTYATNPVCQKDWWWHLLYINNFEKSSQECLAWCWSSAVDMQFYIISPLFMISLIRWPRLGYALIITCISGSCVISFLLSYQYNLIESFARIEFHLDDTRNHLIKFWKYFDVVYSKPYTRISSYLVAILLAYYLHEKSFNKKKARNSATILYCGWIAAISCLWYSFFFLYKREELLIVTAFYNATKHLLFSCGLAWVIYLCLTGQSELLNKCLSWKYFLPLSHVSYCAYLIHPLIILKLVLESPDLIDFSYSSMICLYLYICGFTYAISFVTSILFEVPVLNLLDWFGTKKGKKDSKKTHLC